MALIILPRINDIAKIRINSKITFKCHFSFLISDIIVHALFHKDDLSIKNLFIVTNFNIVLCNPVTVTTDI